MKIYKCDMCKNITKNPMALWGTDDKDEKHFCGFACMAKWIDEQIGQIKQDQEPYDFLKEESIGRTQ